MSAGGGSGSIPSKHRCFLHGLVQSSRSQSEEGSILYLRWGCPTPWVSPHHLGSLCIHSSHEDSDTKAASQLLMGWLCPPQRCWSPNLQHLWMWLYLEIRVFVGDQTKMTALRWALIQHVCMLSCFSRVWLCDPMDHSSLGFSVHGILQARILE